MCRWNTNPVHNMDSLLDENFNGTKTPLKFDSQSCLASNPPFGIKITIKNPKVLNSFELSKNNNSSKKATAKAPDILLLEQNVKLLKPGKGRLAIVLPYQILSGPQTLYIREWILKNCHINTVIDLPKDTLFSHTQVQRLACLL